MAKLDIEKIVRQLKNKDYLHKMHLVWMGNKFLETYCSNCIFKFNELNTIVLECKKDAPVSLKLKRIMRKFLIKIHEASLKYIYRFSR